MSNEELQRNVRLAARALSRSGLAHAYGHCSARLDEQTFVVCASRPMGLVGVDEPGHVVPVEGSLPEGVLGEVRIHQQIYRRRPDVGAVCRTQPRDTMTLSTLRRTPMPRHGFGAYLSPAVPLWDDPTLVRDDDRAALLAEHLGDAPAIVLRGNGAVTVGADLPQAVTLNWYLEDAARLELAVLSLGTSSADPVLLTPDQASARATWQGGIAERMWSYLTAGDPEA